MRASGSRATDEARDPSSADARESLRRSLTAVDSLAYSASEAALAVSSALRRGEGSEGGSDGDGDPDDNAPPTAAETFFFSCASSVAIEDWSSEIRAEAESESSLSLVQSEVRAELRS